METEQQLQSKIILFLRKEGHLPIKNMSVSVAGCPDVTCITKNGTFYVEVKRKGGVLSKIQEHVIATIRALDQTVFITDDLKQFKKEYYEKRDKLP